MSGDSDWSPKRRPYVSYGLLTLPVVAIVVLGLSWDKINEWTRHKPTPGSLEKLAEARALAIRDTLETLREADEKIQESLVASPKAAETNAAFAELQFRWAWSLEIKAEGGVSDSMLVELVRRGNKCAEVARVQADHLPVTRRALASKALFANPPDVAGARELLTFEGAQSDPDAVYLLARVALAEGKTDDAKRYLKQVLKLDEAFLRAHYDLARIAARREYPDTEAATRQLDAVLAVEPTHNLALALKRHLLSDDTKGGELAEQRGIPPGGE